MREVVSFFGSPGTGKSTVLRQRLASYARAVVIDPSPDKGDNWRRAGYRRVGDLPELSKVMAAHFHGSWRYVWTPPAEKSVEALDRLSRLLIAYQERERSPKPMALGLDEMTELYPQSVAQGNGCAGFKRLLLQGRHLEVSILGATQFPQDVAVRFRGASDQVYAFEVYEDAPRKAIIAKIGAENEQKYRSLKPFEYLFFARGRVSLGRTKRGA